MGRRVAVPTRYNSDLTGRCELIRASDVLTEQRLAQVTNENPLRAELRSSQDKPVLPNSP